MTDAGTATIEFLPICSNCGKVIYGVIDYEHCATIEQERIKYPEYQIAPYYCRNCGAIFTRITMPTSLPFDNIQKNNRYS